MNVIVTADAIGAWGMKPSVAVQQCSFFHSYITVQENIPVVLAAALCGHT